eukprot:TRINITY_DN21737_c0_g1_i2.p1 TRINITY_DN21737_c0_g1~~TRINITY_DN21737_c0_g1_i2.p1  ORF type:complete len:1372 (+),score=273.36 TRINITY_DN21737_c0_g1_i2:158-4273(+)
MLSALAAVTLGALSGIAVVALPGRNNSVQRQRQASENLDCFVSEEHAYACCCTQAGLREKSCWGSHGSWRRCCDHLPLENCDPGFARRSCWDGSLYPRDLCCDTRHGPTGFKNCWDVEFTYDTCCEGEPPPQCTSELLEDVWAYMQHRSYRDFWRSSEFYAVERAADSSQNCTAAFVASRVLAFSKLSWEHQWVVLHRPQDAPRHENFQLGGIAAALGAFFGNLWSLLTLTPWSGVSFRRIYNHVKKIRYAFLSDGGPLLRGHLPRSDFEDAQASDESFRRHVLSQLNRRVAASAAQCSAYLEGPRKSAFGVATAHLALAHGSLVEASSADDVARRLGEVKAEVEAAQEALQSWIGERSHSDAFFTSWPVLRLLVEIADLLHSSGSKEQPMSTQHRTKDDSSLLVLSCADGVAKGDVRAALNSHGSGTTWRHLRASPSTGRGCAEALLTEVLQQQRREQDGGPRWIALVSPLVRADEEAVQGALASLVREAASRRLKIVGLPTAAVAGGTWPLNGTAIFAWPARRLRLRGQRLRFERYPTGYDGASGHCAAGDTTSGTRVYNASVLRTLLATLPDGAFARAHEDGAQVAAGVSELLVSLDFAAWKLHLRAHTCMEAPLLEDDYLSRARLFPRSLPLEDSPPSESRTQAPRRHLAVEVAEFTPRNLRWACPHAAAWPRLANANGAAVRSCAEADIALIVQALSSVAGTLQDDVGTRNDPRSISGLDRRQSAQIWLECRRNEESAVNPQLKEEMLPELLRCPRDLLWEGSSGGWFAQLRLLSGTSLAEAFLHRVVTALGRLGLRSMAVDDQQSPDSAMLRVVGPSGLAALQIHVSPGHGTPSGMASDVSSTTAVHLRFWGQVVLAQVPREPKLALPAAGSRLQRVLVLVNLDGASSRKMLEAALRSDRSVAWTIAEGEEGDRRDIDFVAAAERGLEIGYDYFIVASPDSWVHGSDLAGDIRLALAVALAPLQAGSAEVIGLPTLSSDGSMHWPARGLRYGLWKLQYSSSSPAAAEGACEVASATSGTRVYAASTLAAMLKHRRPWRPEGASDETSEFAEAASSCSGDGAPEAARASWNARAALVELDLLASIANARVLTCGAKASRGHAEGAGTAYLREDAYLSRAVLPRAFAEAYQIEAARFQHDRDCFACLLRGGGRGLEDAPEHLWSLAHFLSDQGIATPLCYRRQLEMRFNEIVRWWIALDPENHFASVKQGTLLTAMIRGGAMSMMPWDNDLELMLYSRSSNQILRRCGERHGSSWDDWSSCVADTVQAELASDTVTTSGFLSQWLHQEHGVFGRLKLQVDGLFDIDLDEYVATPPLCVGMFGEVCVHVDWDRKQRGAANVSSASSPPSFSGSPWCAHGCCRSPRRAR